MSLAMSLAMFSEINLDSAYVVPVAGCCMILGIVVAGIWSGVRSQEMRSRERLECIARGITPPPTPEEIALMSGGKAPATGSLARRRANLRLTGIILVAASIGIILFFTVLSIILSTRPVLAGAAVGLIPLAMGLGFLIDTGMQSKEIDQIESTRSL